MDNFPLDFFPKPIQAIIHEAAGVYQFSKCYLGAAVLSACATSMGNVYSIRVKKGWIERPSLYIAVVGVKGLNKSAPVTFALSPIIEREKELYRVYKAEMKLWNQDERNIGTSPPPLLKSVVGDVTPEAVVQQLHKNERGILIYKDELASFFKDFDRYNKSGAEEFYLSVWSGKPVTVDRKTLASIMIPEPVINILGTIQPTVLEEAMTGKVENGMSDRWLIVNPPSLKKEYWSEDDISDSAYESYKRLINRLMDMQMYIDEYDVCHSTDLTYSKAAWSLLKSWQRRNTDAINKSDSEASKGIRAKMEVYISRFALIAHIIEFATGVNHRPDNEIEDISVQKAILLAEYFICQSIGFFEDDPENKLKGSYKSIYEALPDNEITFTTLEFYEQCEFINVSESTGKRFLRDNIGKLINKVKHGVYSKK